MPSPTIVYASTTASTIQAAWDSLLNKIPLTPVTIEVLAGTYTEALTLGRQPYAHDITIQGDTRMAAGSHFTTTGSITKSGGNCTITLVNTPPSDFTSSDHIILGGPASAANAGRFAIVSIDTVAKTVTYVNASGVAEAVRTNTEVIFCPNRILDFTGNHTGVACVSSVGATLSGFTLVSSSVTESFGIHVIGQAELNVSKCVAWNIRDAGFRTTDGGMMNANTTCTAVKCSIGFYAAKNSCINAYDTYASNCPQAGFATALGGQMSAARAISTANGQFGFQSSGGTLYAIAAVASYNQVAGFVAQYNSTVVVDASTARNNATGYAAEWNGLLAALGTNANNSGNTTNYSPATSGVEGNFGAIMNFN